MIRPFAAAGLMVGLVPLLAGSSALAQDDDDGAFDRTPQDCIQVTRIDKTEAIDDQNIIFYMRGRQVFRNHLPRACPGLERENRIAYRTNAGRLCSIDTITVLEQWGVGFREAFTCRLGEFVPLSPAEVEELDFREDRARGRRRGRARSPIEATEVQLEPDEAAGAEAATEPGAPAEQ
jgi:hypothetical protein